MIAKQNRKLGNWLLLFFTFLIYSFSSIFSKLASTHAFLSLPYLLFFLCVIISLGIYAFFWQKILVLYPLNKAYLYKSSTIIIILLISHFLFHEEISINNIIGILFIIAGLFVLTWEKV